MSQSNSCDNSPNKEKPLSPVSKSSESSGNADNGLREELCNDIMTSSYTEISFDQSDDEQTDVEFADEIAEANLNSEISLANRVPGSMSLPQLSSTIVNWSEKTKASYETENLQIKTPIFDHNNSGTLSFDGQMVSFISKDFEEKLNLSSLSIDSELPKIDLRILRNLENQVKQLAQNINHMLNHISESSQTMTSLTVECMSTYEDCLNKTCDVVDANIKSMYQLMAKCEELNQAMKPINNITDELKEVKRILDLFEKAVE